MKKQLSAILALALALTLVLSACGGTNGDAGTSPDANTPDGGASVYPLTFDNYGRTITVEARPQKVLALGPNCAETMAALGLADFVIGTSLKNHSRGPLPEFADAVNAMPELNYSSATREAVISSGADFIYGLDWEFGGSGLDTEELAGYGITVYIDSATTLEQTYQEILDIGKIFGVEDAAAAFVAEQKARVQAVADKIAGAARPSVLVCDAVDDGIFTATGVNYETLLMDLAGGANVFADLTDKAWTTVSYEEVLKREPDVVMIHDYDAPSVEEKIASIKANPTLSQLACVKDERFVVIELESVLPGDRTAYTVEKLARGFYPDLFQ
ncbi:MAG: ABC transporter substrate-binding protein [Oscillospiraceae bacterium]|jgi:iron complex transport system substrate-binding protein|nr:ABC transporter substrate-binding protein [Oscillospiraceae bacterium]